MVLVVSFVALAVLWPTPKLEGSGWRPLPRLSKVLGGRAAEIACGALGVFVLGVVVWAGLTGMQTTVANFAPVFVYVTFWVGLVAVSLLFGDVFRAFNPWRAIARAVAWISQTAARGPLPAPLTYPERLGHWPAALGLFAFATLEIVVADGQAPETVAVAALVYSAVTFVGMALYGIEAWAARGEAFGVYFGLFARLSVWERRGRQIGVRKPLAGLASFEPGAGTVALLAVMIGTVTFDGLSEAPLWTGVAPDIASFFESLGLSPERGLEATFFVGMAGAVLLVAGFYRLGVAGAQSAGGGFSGRRLANVFAASLVPIALAYVAAHYLTLLLYQGQAVLTADLNPFGYLVSNPLGEAGTDLFGTADRAIDYGVIDATTAWYVQVGFVVVGHVAALTLAHDKALAVYDDTKVAVRSQYWLLVVMVGFTSLALWLLAQSNG